VQGHQSIGLGKSIKPTRNHKKQQQTKSDDPQIFQPDLRFASGKTKQTAKLNQKSRTGPEPKQNTHVIDLPQDALLSTTLFAKAC